LALVKRIADQHPEWGPKELEELHQELEAWGVKAIVVKFTTPGGTEVHGPTLLKGKVVLDDPL
jgi:hypothetical protein